MPAGILVSGNSVVKEICAISKKENTYESVSAEDLLECLEPLIKYILSKKTNKHKAFYYRKNKHMKKTSVLYLHGGMTFKNEKDFLKYILKERGVSTKNKVRWSNPYLGKALGSKFEVTNPRMPLQDWAQYKHWEPYFERFLPLLNDKYILIGESLGAIFLAKYLSEHKLKRKALSVYLVGAPFEDTLPHEDLVGGFELKNDLSLLEQNCKNLYLIFSKDDDVIPVAHAEKFRKKLQGAKILILNNKHGHFNVEKFPEIVKMIKADVARK